MRLFILMILQALVFLPFTSFAAEGEINPVTQKQDKTEVSQAQKAGVIESYGKLPLYFIENRGQVNEAVSFYEKGGRHATFFTSGGVVITLTKSEGKAGNDLKLAHLKDINVKKARKQTTESVTLSFVGANKKAGITADEKKTGHINYFKGNDKSEWRSNIPTYGAVTYNDVYKNIDIKFYGNNKNIEHDIIVRPGGDISALKFAYKGVQGLKVTEGGELEVSLTHGSITQKRPFIYQDIKGERVAVEGSYKILKGEEGSFAYGFDIASYDKTKELVIDPVLVYSTYLGGSVTDFGWDIAVDSTGAAYIVGGSNSTDFPLANPIQGVLSGSYDLFITKINPAGTALVWSTYLGGSSFDNGLALALDSSGAAYVTGQTSSLDFPLVAPIQGAHGGGLYDSFITKINSAGTAIVYSTYLGGFDREFSSGIVVDALGAAYISGNTWSTDFPLVNPVQATNGGSRDVFITKINPAGTAYEYSTYLGGAGDDLGGDIALDSSGAAYVTGSTSSSNFPLLNPLQGTHGGWPEGFVTKINAAGSALIWSTYLGGASFDYGVGIALDSVGAVYVTGETRSTNFPTVNPIQANHGGALTDGYVTKINAAGSAIIWSTYLGGIGLDNGIGIVVDGAGAAYVTGSTESTNFPLVSPVQGAIGGGRDAFVTKINASGTAFDWSTYLGGTSDDYAAALALDSSGSTYVTGQTNSTDFPTASPLQATSAGGDEAFISKIGDTSPPPPVVTLTIVPDAVTVVQGATLGYTVTATNTTAVQQCFQYWENITMPGGGAYPPVGELFGPIRLCLNGSQSVHLTHGVPLLTPLGAYVFNGYLGAYAFPVLPFVVDEDHFNFDILAPVAPLSALPHTSWRLIENGFRQ